MIRLVLDTNVVLETLHFRDPRALRLESLIRAKGAACFTDVGCFAEFERVCAYRAFGLSEDARTALIEEYRRRTVFVDSDGEPDAAAGAKFRRIPLCDDADDQKFLNLAARCKADALLTRDKALLKLARRFSGCAILLPEAACDFLQNPKSPGISTEGV